MIVPSDYIFSDFEFIDSSQEKNNMRLAYASVKKRNFMPEIKAFDEESFMTTDNRKILEIMNTINKDSNEIHSGCSIAWTMQQLRFIARYGEDKYIKEWLN